MRQQHHLRQVPRCANPNPYLSPHPVPHPNLTLTQTNAASNSSVKHQLSIPNVLILEVSEHHF